MCLKPTAAVSGVPTPYPAGSLAIQILAPKTLLPSPLVAQHILQDLLLVFLDEPDIAEHFT